MGLLGQVHKVRQKYLYSVTIRGEHKYTVEAYDADEAVARAEEYFRGGMVADETECKCAEDTVCEGRA